MSVPTLLTLRCERGCRLADCGLLSDGRVHLTGSLRQAAFTLADDRTLTTRRTSAGFTAVVSPADGVELGCKHLPDGCDLSGADLHGAVNDAKGQARAVRIVVRRDGTLRLLP